MVFKIRLKDGSYEYNPLNSGQKGGQVWSTLKGIKSEFTRRLSTSTSVTLPLRYEGAKVEVYKKSKVIPIEKFIESNLGDMEVFYDEI